MANNNIDEDNASSSTNPAITYTRTRKTKTAASSSRRRNNIQHSVGGGNSEAATGSDKSWFSRKASGWTDDEIRSHLVSGKSNGGGSLSMEGDLIQGGIDSSSTGRKKRRRNDRNHNHKRRLGPRFAWEEEEEEEDAEEDGEYYSMQSNGQGKSIMRAAPTLQNIMDEQDQIDLLAPQKLGKEYQPSSLGGDGDDNDHARPNRRNNAALVEIAQLYENNDTHTGAVAPTAATDSIGWRLLRVLGWRSRLGLGFVSLPGFSAGNDDDDQANDLESMHLTKNLSAKHLASKGLRAIRLPSIAQSTSSNDKPKAADEHSSNQTLVIPPPKLNTHGMGFDPFKDAPEFRAFHEKRKAMAHMRGRADDKSIDSRSTAYFTDNLRRDDRQSLWDKNSGDNGNDTNTSNQRSGKQDDGQHMNYAAHDYTDFIGTKASSGFALEDEDDTNVYQDDDHDGYGFPTSSSNRSGYNLEIHSPVASEDEDDDNNNGLFHHSNASTSIRKPSSAKKSRNDGRNMAGAWDAWGMGEDSAKAVTSDGKQLLPGFQLGQQKNNHNSIKRWTGPIMPSGYTLKRHVPIDDSAKATSAYTVNTPDCGLGLDLQHRSNRWTSRPSVPTVLPHTEQKQQSQMRARDGTELNFNAVKESMKNRFVSSSNGNIAPKKSDIEDEVKDKEEWIDVTSTSWMPSRLLCKRWGIPLPSTITTSTSNTSKDKVSTTGEEAYFHETVLLKQKRNDGGKGSIVGTQTENTKDDTYIMVDQAIDGDTADPPPNRPSHDIFKSIFDASSDMDISSSSPDDDEDEVQDSAVDSASASRSNMRMEENIISYEPSNEPVTARSGSSSPESEVSHESRKRRHHKEDRHRKKSSSTRRRRSPSNSPESDNSTREEYDKRRKKKKKRHKRSHSRHKEKRRR